MQWQQDDIKKYVQAKEYIDTIIMPLQPFHLTKDEKIAQTSYENEILTIFSNELEKELSGRTMRIPSYTYVRSADKEKELERMKTWVTDIQEQPFEHLFFPTFDMTWKKHEINLPGNLIWLPVTQVEEIQSKEFKKWIHENVLQVSELIRSYW